MALDQLTQVSSSEKCFAFFMLNFRMVSRVSTVFLL